MSTGIEKYVSRAMKLRILAGDEPAWMQRHIRRDYIRSSFLAAPLWMTSSEFKGLRDLADDLTFWTGVKHVLDHVVPISHPNVCGLNVPWNIAVVPRLVNASKSNRWHPDQLALL